MGHGLREEMLAPKGVLGGGGGRKESCEHVSGLRARDMFRGATSIDGD